MIKIDKIRNSGFVKNYANATAKACNHNDDKSGLIKSCGWFLKNKSILKYLVRQEDSAPTARCFECYKLIGFEDIEYSRIISNYKQGVCAGMDAGVRIGASQELIGFEKYYKLSVLCSHCVSSLATFKTAPKTYGDVIADLLIRDKLAILAADISKIGCAKLENVNESIVKALFNYNEKQIMLIHIGKENDNLKRNLEMEIEKHRILSEYKSKNRELQESMRNNLLQSSIDLYKTHKKVIDEQIAKYSEYNNSTRYSIPECRVCMQNEISMTLECGHLLCVGCHDNLHTENKKKLIENENENENVNEDENENVSNDTSKNSIDGYSCPFCKTFSSKFIKIYM